MTGNKTKMYNLDCVNIYSRKKLDSKPLQGALELLSWEL